MVDAEMDGTKAANPKSAGRSPSKNRDDPRAGKSKVQSQAQAITTGKNVFTSTTHFNQPA